LSYTSSITSLLCIAFVLKLPHITIPLPINDFVFKRFSIPLILLHRPLYIISRNGYNLCVVCIVISNFNQIFKSILHIYSSERIQIIMRPNIPKILLYNVSTILTSIRYKIVKTTPSVQLSFW